ncbi:transcription termination/antitermination NusG family protein [Pseudomonas sp. PSPC3-3]|uniref:transcription termination/antitermination NusG family protein n=1 Tax=unclassified Pseudomonas TaxID=196821 RepID=UPI003CE7C8FF
MQNLHKSLFSAQKDHNISTAKDVLVTKSTVHLTSTVFMYSKAQENASIAQARSRRVCGGLHPKGRVLGMQSWYLITHNLHGFQIVTTRLEALGVEIYSPTMTEISKRQDCKAVRVKQKQLFPGYLFLRFDPEDIHTTTISDVPGVKGFVRFGPTICTAPDTLIEALKQSLLLKADKALSNIECRNVTPDVADALRSITRMKDQLERQTAFFALLQKESGLLNMASLPYSRISSATSNAC